MGKIIIVFKAQEAMFLTKVKELIRGVLWVGRKDEWFTRALSILVLANSEFIDNTFRCFQENLFANISDFSVLPILFFFKSSLNFIHPKNLTPILCKAHMLGAIEDLKINSLDMEVGEEWDRQNIK